MVKQIQKDFNEIIKFTQGLENPQTDNLFKKWLEAKRDFIEAFGGKYIYEIPEKVTFELDEQQKKERVTDLCENIDLYNPALSDFICKNFEGFFDNRVVASCYTPEGVAIPKGMKLLKAFKYFTPNKEQLYEWQNKASMVIQENKITGKLCLSVHPVDFLTLSENNHNWRSCHSLDGEYRSGNISYMTDKSTFICYLKSDEDEELSNLPPSVKWNSKKWRVLLFTSDYWEFIVAGRQYPFSSFEGLEYIRKMVLPILGFGDWTEWQSDLVKSWSGKDLNIKFGNRYIPMGNELKSLRDVIIKGEDSLNFNDVLDSSLYSPVWIYKIRPNPSVFAGFFKEDSILYANKKTQVIIGNGAPCLNCGNKKIKYTERMLCEECITKIEDDEVVFCDLCGELNIMCDNVYYLPLYDQWVCEDCYCSSVYMCDCCGEQLYEEDVYSWYNGLCYCKVCSSKEEEEDLDG